MTEPILSQWGRQRLQTFAMLACAVVGLLAAPLYAGVILLFAVIAFRRAHPIAIAATAAAAIAVWGFVAITLISK